MTTQTNTSPATHTVVGIFDTAANAEKAKQQLMSGGFTAAAVDVSTRSALNADGTRPSGMTGTGAMGAGTTASATAPEEGGVGGFFRSLFGADNGSDYATVASEHDAIITVHARSHDEAKRAASILDDAGAVDIDDRIERSCTSATQTVGTQTNTTGSDGNTVKVIEENLAVGKRVVQSGGARIRSQIVQRPVEESIRLRSEHVSIQRTPVNRPVNAADLQAFQGKSVEIVEHAEVAVVAKEARVVEEIGLKKDTSERTEVIRDTVRGTEVQVEELGRTERATTDTTPGVPPTRR